jgi:predicted nucleic-acid-binding Zn-ribbon protein
VSGHCRRFGHVGHQRQRRQETAQFLLWSYKTSKSSSPLMDKDKFDKAIAYAISKGYFRDPSTPDIDQSTDEGGLITLRTPRGAKVAQFQTDGDSFDGIGNLSKKIAATKSSYTCPKCGSTSYETGQIRVSGGAWAAIMDVENKRYNSVSCTKCGYTEFYKETVSRGEQVLDFLAD